MCRGGNDGMIYIWRHATLTFSIFFLALALLPTSALAEELERQKEDPTENPPVIYLDKNDPRHKSRSKELVTPSDDPKIVPPLGQKRPGRGMSQYEWFKKEEEEKGPWHTRFLKSYDIPLGSEYLYELPQPDYAEIERLKEHNRSGIQEIGYMAVKVKVDNPKLNWKYLGEKDVDGKPKHVWITAIYAQGAKQIGFNGENVTLCRGCAIYVYGNVKYKGRPVAENLSDPYINFALTPGDTAYIEYHADTLSSAPNKGHPFTFSNYDFGFVPMFDYIENPPVIYLDKKKDGNTSAEIDKDGHTPQSTNPNLVPPISQRAPDSYMNRLQKEKAEEAQKGPWYKRKLKTFGSDLEAEYIYQLPLPSSERLEEVENDPSALGLVVDVDIKVLKWKYIGEKLVEGKTKRVWLTALSARGAKNIQLSDNQGHLCDTCVIFAYGTEDDLIAWDMNEHQMFDRGNFREVFSGDTLHLEYQAENDKDDPNNSSTITISEYVYGLKDIVSHFSKKKFLGEPCTIDYCDYAQSIDTSARALGMRDCRVACSSSQRHRPPPRKSAGSELSERFLRE